MSREFDASDLPDEANIQVDLAHEGSNPGEGDDPAGDVAHACLSVCLSKPCLQFHCLTSTTTPMLFPNKDKPLVRFKKSQRLVLTSLIAKMTGT
jgi:hypothetical protein